MSMSSSSRFGRSVAHELERLASRLRLADELDVRELGEAPGEPLQRERLVVHGEHAQLPHSVSSSGRRISTRKPPSGRRRGVERARLAVAGAQPLAHVRKPDARAAGQRVRATARPVVVDAEHERARVAARARGGSRPARRSFATPWRTAFSTIGCSSRCGTSAWSSPGLDVGRQAHAPRKARALDVEVVRLQLDLLRERHLERRLGRERGAIEARELVDELAWPAAPAR